MSLNVDGATKDDEEKYFNLIEMMNANTLAKFLRMNKFLCYANKIKNLNGKEFKVKRKTLYLNYRHSIIFEWMTDRDQIRTKYA